MSPQHRVLLRRLAPIAGIALIFAALIAAELKFLSTEHYIPYLAADAAAPSADVPPDAADIIGRIRAGSGTSLTDAEEKALNDWLMDAVVIGQTNQSDIAAIFGNKSEDLNRPDRDSIISIQYRVGGYGNETSIQFDFGGKSKALTGWSFGHAICGFCPHIFVNQRKWSLEGKTLAGYIGIENEGRDLLLLPRLEPAEGRLDVKLSNLAPEIDYIDNVQLGTVELHAGEELDVGTGGEVFAWRPAQELEQPLQQNSKGGSNLTLQLTSATKDRVVVLEIRNTASFESAMRDFVLGKSADRPLADIAIRFDQSSALSISPVGTKLYRRVVVPVPTGAKTVHLQAPQDFWLVKRVWTGTGMSRHPNWLGPDAVSQSKNDFQTLSDVLARDGKRLALQPMEEVELEFRRPPESDAKQRFGYVLRMSGYYDFLQSTTQH